MRDASTYRANRRNLFMVKSRSGKLGRSFFKDFTRMEGSNGKSVEPSYRLFIPPTQPNKNLRENGPRHKLMVIPA